MPSKGIVSKRGWWAFGLTTGGVVWGVLILLGAYVLPAYGGSETDLSGHTWSTTSETLVQMNGSGVLLPVSIPLVVAVLVWLALHRRCSHGSPATVAWVLISLLWGFVLLTGFSIGFTVLPVAGLLTAGARLTPPGSVAVR